MISRNGYDVKIRYESRLEFSKCELLEEFNKFYPLMNEMAAKLEKNKQLSQVGMNISLDEKD